MLASASVRGNGTPGKPERRQLRQSAKARAALKLQGRYMGYVRQLRVGQKAAVRKVREMKGIRAAIAKARGLTKIVAQ